MFFIHSLLNIFRLAVEGVEARNIEEAISALNVSNSPAVDKHPEKRMKAAYEVFENVVVMIKIVREKIPLLCRIEYKPCKMRYKKEYKIVFTK